MSHGGSVLPSVHLPVKLWLSIRD